MGSAPPLLAARARRVAGIACALVATSCGARSGLRTPDVVAPLERDALAPCIDARYTLVPRRAEVMLVIDRSGSMDEALDGRTSTRTRWVALRDQLASTLPDFSTQSFVGATFFPDASGGCMVRPDVDAPPALNNANAVLEVLQRTHPAGETPTYEAIRITSAFLQARGDDGNARFIMLATDGGPTCNPDTRSVFDVDRTVDMIANTARHGIPTFVIGLDDPTAPGLADALRRMALAGGRPNVAPGRPRYYSVRDEADLEGAFRTIQRALALCVLTSPARDAPGATFSVELGASVIPRDPSRADGWDWTDSAAGEITVFGAACERLAEAGEAASIVSACPPDP